MQRLPGLLVVAALVASAIPAAAQERPVVVAVNYPLAYFAERLTSGDAEIVYPVPEGRDPAFWRPGIADISSIQAADLILLNGADFAAWVARATLPRSRLVDTSRSFADAYIVTESITHSHGAEGEHAHTGVASFTWLDQDLAIRQAQAIAEALKRRGIGGAVDDRLAELTGGLRELDLAGERLRPLAEGRTIVTSHPRYQYLARAYGLTVAAVDWEAGETPNDDQLATLRTIVRDTGATVFLWEAAPPAPAREAIRAMGLRDVVFPTLAAPPPDGDYASALLLAFEELEAALVAD